MSELKPCPCCASDRVDFITGHFVHATDQFSEGQSFAKVWCKRCQMRTGPEKTKREAALIWNRRAVPTIGTRYRDESGELVAVVAPAEATADIIDELTISKIHPATAKWRSALATLPDPK